VPREDRQVVGNGIDVRRNTQHRPVNSIGARSIHNER
jgi:hypothetical protein